MEGRSNAPDFWKVIEDNPFPDDYISILAPGWSSRTFVPHSLHPSFQEAAKRAHDLKIKWKVTKIYIFYPEGNRQKWVEQTNV